MRYRQDVAPGTDIEAIIEHVCAHLAGAVHPDDDPTHRRHEVRITVNSHEDPSQNLITVIGELDGEPNAPYLRPGFNPSTDHPDITFSPYENPDQGQLADHAALRRFREAP